MLSTVASLVTGVMLISAPTVNEPIQQEFKTQQSSELMVSHSEVSFAVSVNSTTEELDDIKAAAEEAGMAFTYKKRGVKTRLVIDMIIETSDDYTMDRIVLRDEDGTKYIKWAVDEAGNAVAFVKGDNIDLTQNSK